MLYFTLFLLQLPFVNTVVLSEEAHEWPTTTPASVMTTLSLTDFMDFLSANDKLECASDNVILHHILVVNRYSKYRLPNPKGVTVTVGFLIQEITAVNEMTSDFEMDLYVSEWWHDPGLRYEHLNPCRNNISLNHEVYTKVWTPNLSFVNAKQATIHDSPFRNIVVQMMKNGTVWANYRVKVRGPCKMDLTSFPLDIQKCRLVFESYSYNRDQIRLAWLDQPEPVWTLDNFTLPDFVLSGIEVDSGTLLCPGGVWDELYATFVFKRQYNWYIVQAYIPSYMIIFISWVSFALGSKAIPARTMLGVNSLLSMVVMFGNIMKSLPRVSYITAFDVWMLSCITFIFFSLLELAVVVLLAKEKNLGFTEVHTFDVDHESGECNEKMKPGVNFYGQYLAYKMRRLSSDRIDRISCLAFPVLFSIFNVIYWSYYRQH